MNEGVCEFLVACRPGRSRERKSRDLRVNKVRESRSGGAGSRDKVIGDRFRRETVNSSSVPETVGTAFRRGRKKELRREGVNAFLPR